MNKNWKQRLALVGAFAVMGLSAMAQTNTASGIFTSVTGDFTDVFDALIAIAVAVLTVTVGFALVKSMVPSRAKLK